MKKQKRSSRPGKNLSRKENSYLLQETALYRQPLGAPLVCHLYPNSYSVGMSNLGFQKSFQLWQGEGDNQHDGYSAERAFMPDNTSFPSRKLPQKALSFETARAITDFAVLSVSVSYEFDFFNLIRFLHIANIPLKATERDESSPLIIIGGAALTINPLPVSEIADIIVMGEAESILKQMRNIVIENLGNRKKQLQKLRELPGVYFFGKSKKTSRLYEQPLSSPTHSLFLSPHTSFSDTFLIETGRGCGAHCRFCTAGYLYRPPRHYSKESLLNTLEKGMERTNKIGLFASDVMGNNALLPLLEKIKENQKKVTLSSFRMDKYDHTIIQHLAECGTKSITIAPEAANEELRRSLNKPISNDDFFNQLEQIYDTKMFNIKLYFLIGLPNETEEQVTEILKFVEKVKEVMLKAGKKLGHLSAISVGVNHIIPKTITPWYNLLPDSIETTERKTALLAPIASIPNVELKMPTHYESLLQTLLSAGDETILPLLKSYALSSKWQKELTIDELHNRTTTLITEGKAQSKLENLFDMGFQFNYLRKEQKRGEEGKYTIDCLNRKKCDACGLSC